MQELICFSAFLYQYIESFVFLEVARRRGLLNLPLAPVHDLAPSDTISLTDQTLKICTLQHVMKKGQTMIP